MKKIALTVGLLAAGVTGAALGWPGLSSLFAEDAAPEAETYTVRRGSLTEVASASGTIEPHVQVEVKSRAAGEVLELLVEEGDVVEAGQLLARLDAVDAQRAVEEARIAVRRLEAELVTARSAVVVADAEAADARAVDAARQRGRALGIVSTDDARSAATQATVSAQTRTQRVAQVNSTRAQLDAARLAVEEAQLRLSETEVRTRVAGTVLSVDVERGSIVSSGLSNATGGTPLMTIADLDDLRVIGRIDESEVGRVARGQSVAVRVDAYPRRVFVGRVERVASIGEEESSVVTFDVEIAITDADASLLRSGMSADVEIVTREITDALLVPLTAIHTVDGRQVVTLANGEARPIRTGSTSGGQIEVLGGLEEGESIQLGATGAAPSASSARGSRPSMPFGGGPPGMGRGPRS